MFFRGSFAVPVCVTLSGFLLGTAGARAQTVENAEPPSPASNNATALPAITVEGKKPALAKKATQKAVAKVKTATKPSVPQAPAAPEPGLGQSGETATGPVEGYTATRTATGSKTDTPILETPQSVSVITADQIKDQAARSLKEALRYTPGVVSSLNGPSSRYDEARIRGFSPVQYLDGLALPLNQFFGTPRIEPYGLERIEALKGPGSFLFGQNSPGGLLNMVSKRPLATPLNEVQLEYGSFDHKQAMFDFSGPLSSGKEVLYRFTGVIRDADTEVDFTKDNLGYIAPAITWRPSADTTLTMLGSYGYDDGSYVHQYVPTRGSLLPNPNGRVSRSWFSGEPGYSDFEREQFTIGYELEHRFNEAFTARQNLRYAGVDMSAVGFRIEDYVSFPDTVGRSNLPIDADARTFTVDNQLQANVRTGPVQHKVLVGLDYLRTTGDYQLGFAPGAPIDVYNPVYGQPIANPVPIAKNHSLQDQVGLYAQDQLRLGGWILTLGGRSDWVENTTDDLLGGQPVSREDQAYTGRAGLTYLFENGIAPYVSYATSFQPTSGVDVAGQPFKPTTGDQTEVGIKFQPTGTKALLTVAAFEIHQQDAVTFDPATFAGVQSGEVRVRGFDIDARTSLTENFDLIFGYAYLDGETTDSINPIEIGRPVTLVPMHQASVWGKYTFHQGMAAGLGLGAGVRYVGETVAEISSPSPVQIPDHTIFDAAFSYDLGKISKAATGAELSLNVSNVFDKYYVEGYCDTVYCTLGSGRTFLGALKYRW